MSSYGLPGRMTILVALVLLGGACSAAEQPGPSDSPSPTPTQTASETPDDSAAPGTIAAVLTDGSLAMLDTQSGEVVETLREGLDVNDPTDNGIAVAPDGRIYVVLPATPPDNLSQIVRIDPDGDEEQVVTEGRSLALSPDGTKLAYVAFRDEEPPIPGVVVRDLESGDERRLSREDEPPFTFIATLAWLSGDRLAFEAGEISTGAYVIDSDAQSLDSARRLGPKAPVEGSWSAVARYGEQHLAVVETCCDIPERERWTVVAVDPDTAAVQEDILPQQRVEAYHLDSDASGRHLLLMTDYGRDGGALLRWSIPADPSGTNNGAELTTVREGVVVAAW